MADKKWEEMSAIEKKQFLMDEHGIGEKQAAQLMNEMRLDEGKKQSAEREAKAEADDGRPEITKLSKKELDKLKAETRKKIEAKLNKQTEPKG